VKPVVSQCYAIDKPMVSMRSLDRKLLRELWHLKGQMASIAMVVAVGIMSIITMRGSHDSLVDTQQSYYRQTRFADVWAPLVRAPETLLSRLAAIPGVASATTRISFLTTLDLPGLDMPAQGLFVSLPARSRPPINDIVLMSGRYLRPGAGREILVNHKFAEARRLAPGDSLVAIINGQRSELEIVGTAVSPEHAYSVPPGSLYPDDERYGVIWMSREALGPAYEMDGAFNEALFTLSRGSREQAVLAEIDRLLEPYGGQGAHTRRDQASHQILQSELEQNRVIGTVIPGIFLGVATFLLNIVLGRLIATQRGEIGVLKAFGYRDREVGNHFLMFALTAVFLGAVPGVLIGVWLGEQYVALYGQYFNFPQLDYRLGLPQLAKALLVILKAAVLGALSAVRRAVRLPPAEAMRAELPARFRASVLERLFLFRWVSSSVRMILRNLHRKPVQSLLSSLGVALSTAILLVGLAVLDGVNFMMNLQFEVIQREDLMLGFDENLDDEVVSELARIAGVTRVEPFRHVPTRLRNGHLYEEVVLQGIDPDAQLRRVVAGDGRPYPLPAEGLVLSAILAERLQVHVGDRLQVEVREGQRQKTDVLVSGVVEDFMSLSGTMSLPLLHRLAQGPAQLTGAYLQVDANSIESVNRYLKDLPEIASVTSPTSMLASFRKQMSETLYVSTSLLIGFASVIATGVIYNGARISLSERGRELASLRVMGFRRSEAVALLLGEQAIITLLAIPIGWFIGYWLSFGVVVSIENDTYRLPFLISHTSYLWSALVTVGAACLSGFLIRRRINRMDLIDVLKTRE